jgi:radical SAM superfamily enzyme YgiQ (UPF0313 family)
MNYDFIITSDRTMITNHHNNEFLGFMTTAPAIGLPELIWKWISAPKIKVDKIGRPIQAPYGLRKIEAALLDAGFKATIIDPDYIHKHLDSAKAIMIGHHDYFALASPSCEWKMLTNKEPINAKCFRKFLTKIINKIKDKKDLKIIVGGPAAWQWLYVPKLIKKYRINTVINGEGEKVIKIIAQKILNGEALPNYIEVDPSDSPKLNEIALIRYPSINGLIEIMRGCPRGCKFCSVTSRPIRFYTLEMIEKELKVNNSYGINHGIIHAEDVLLYGADGIKPKLEPLLKLHNLINKYYENISWSHLSLSSLKYAQENYKAISKIIELVYSNNQDWIGVEVGIETGSPNLAKKIMPAKAAPYPVEKWPEIVEDAFRIMHEHKIIPAATLIIGLPNETDDDIIRTIELIDRLKDYRSLIIPMFFVPMGILKNEKWFKASKIKNVHIELSIACLKHDLYWARDILSKYYLKRKHEKLMNFLIKILIYYFEVKLNKYLKENKIQ